MAGWIDVSVAVSPDLPTWPGDPSIAFEPSSRIAKGDPANVSRLLMGDHTGTHVDPQCHFVPGGGTTDDLDLSVLMGPAWVADLPAVRGQVEPADLEASSIPAGTKRLLLKTSNSGTLHPGAAFRKDFVALSPDGAEWALGRGIRLVGIDYLSIERFDAPFEHPVHHALLAAGAIILEGLDLSDVPGGACELLCLPLRLAGADGAPARALVRPA